MRRLSPNGQGGGAFCLENPVALTMERELEIVARAIDTVDDALLELGLEGPPDQLARLYREARRLRTMHEGLREEIGNT